MPLLSLPGPAHPPSPSPSPALLHQLRIKPREKRGTNGKVLPGVSSPPDLHTRLHFLRQHVLLNILILGYNHARGRDEEIRKLFYCDPRLEVDIDYVSYLSYKKAHLILKLIKTKKA